MPEIKQSNNECPGNFWGVQVHRVGLNGSGNEEETLIPASDRDSGLWIFRYTGDDDPPGLLQSLYRLFQMSV